MPSFIDFIIDWIVAKKSDFDIFKPQDFQILLIAIFIISVAIHYSKKNRQLKVSYLSLKLGLVYLPIAIVSVHTFLGFLYIHSYYEQMGASNITFASAMQIALSSVMIWINDVLSFVIVATSTIMTLTILADRTIDLNKIRKQKPWALFLILSASLSIATGAVTIIAKAFGEGASKAKAEMSNFKTIPHATITLNDKLVEKGIIVAMSDSMVWIYNGKETVAMKIGNHKITTPVVSNDEKTTD